MDSKTLPDLSDSWLINLSFAVYVLITMLFLGSYFYFLLFQKDKHKRDQELGKIPTSPLLNRVTKEWWIWMIAPIEKFIIAKKIHPLTIGYISLVFSGLACVGYGFGWFVFAGWSVLLAGTCDIFDGRVSRKLGLDSKKGEFLDSNLDRWCESLWYLGLFNYYANTLFFYVVFIAFISSLMVSYAKARGESLNISGRIGVMQRAERIVWLGAASVFSPLFSAIFNYLIPVSTTFLASLSILVIATMTSYTYYQRFQYVTRHL